MSVGLVRTHVQIADCNISGRYSRTQSGLCRLTTSNEWSSSTTPHLLVPSTKAWTFKLKPQEFTATIKIPATETLDITLGNANVKQIPVNSNIATTGGHKLQGMSKDVLIINNWDYLCANWVYVVLSRVRTLELDSTS